LITSIDYFRIKIDDSQNPLDQSENISRFILSKNHFAASKKRVKYNAFLPPPDLELSVFRISGLPDNQIWEIGREIVAQPQGKTAKGRGDFLAALATENELSIIPDQEPHELHANIIGWPENKAKQKLIAAKLADKAELKLPS